jgi:hypothetical protein
MRKRNSCEMYFWMQSNEPNVRPWKRVFTDGITKSIFWWAPDKGKIISTTELMITIKSS